MVAGRHNNLEPIPRTGGRFPRSRRCTCACASRVELHSSAAAATRACSQRLHSLHQSTVHCFCTPSVMSTWQAQHRTELQSAEAVRCEWMATAEGGRSGCSCERTCDLMQLAHMFAGFGGIASPHRQHSTVPGVACTANMVFTQLPS